MMLRPRRRSFVAVTAMTAAFLAALATVAGCTSEPAPDQTPAQASETIVQLMQLTPETGTCLRKVFDAKPELVSALNPEPNTASQSRVDEFVAAVRPCLTAQVLAEAYPKVASAGFPLDDAQKQCVRDGVLAMDEPTRDLLIRLGAGIPTQDLAAVSKPASEIAQKCKIGTVPVPGSSDTVGPGGGATAITR